MTELPIFKPRPPRLSPNELTRIVLSMTVACLVGAGVLGLVYLGTDRYRRASALATERDAVRDMLGLDARASLLEVRQYLLPDRRQVLYRAAPFGRSGGPAREVAFGLDGRTAGGRRIDAAAPLPAGAVPLGRLFVARRDGRLAGFVVEGEARGYKNRIRMFVALTAGFQIADMRVVEHEEDPGLGAEVAQPWFREQFVGRTAAEVSRLDVTRDPMPEDWKSALLAFARRAPDGPARHAALLARERGRPIYAVTGATISSRAVTDGVRATVEHFRRRWALLAPSLGEER